MPNTLVLLISGLLISAALPLAHAQDARNQGYLADSYGNIVRSLGANACVRTSDWTPARAVAECDPDLVKKPAPAPKPPAKPKPKAKPKPSVETDWLHPPRPSRHEEIGHALLARGAAAPTLDYVAERLRRALYAAGYSALEYYEVGDNGFVLATPLEQISENGVPKSGAERWITDIKPLSLRGMTLRRYLEALTHANPGYFRAMFFVITDQKIEFREGDFTLREFRGGLHGASPSLPPELRGVALSGNHRCDVLVYEFQQYAVGEPARLNRRVLPKTDLDVTGIRAALRRKE